LSNTRPIEITGLKTVKKSVNLKKDRQKGRSEQKKKRLLNIEQALENIVKNV
jgi:hypothetical protein